MFEHVTQAIHGFFSRIRGRRTISQGDFDALLRQMHDALISADIPQHIVDDLLVHIRHEVIGTEVLSGGTPAESIAKMLHDYMVKLLGSEQAKFVPVVPMTLLMVGLQGSGKTTTLAKLVQRTKKALPKARILLISLDFYRPAAREQLAQLAGRVGVDYYATQALAPIPALAEAMRYRLDKGYDVLGIDTAGRLHTDAALLDELHEIFKRAEPTHTLLVLDGMTGQAGLGVVQEFQKAVSLTGAIISKTDSGARAGAALVFRTVTGKPLLFLGVGEGLDDLEPFVPERIAQRLFGQGDLASLLEHAEERISVTERQAAEHALLAGRMTLDDFAQQLNMVKKMGSMASLSKYLPGGLAGKMNDEQLHQGEKEMRMFCAIISSMTRKERINPAMLGVSRKRRVARGAGVRNGDIDKLLVAFEEIQRYAKLMKNFKVPYQKNR